MHAESRNPHLRAAEGLIEVDEVRANHFKVGTADIDALVTGSNFVPLAHKLKVAGNPTRHRRKLLQVQLLQARPPAMGGRARAGHGNPR